MLRVILQHAVEIRAGLPKTLE